MCRQWPGGSAAYARAYIREVTPPSWSLFLKLLFRYLWGVLRSPRIPVPVFLHARSPVSPKFLCPCLAFFRTAKG